MEALNEESSPSDAGFTLIELVVSVLLMAVISTVLVGAIFMVLQNSSYTLGRTATRGTAQDQLVSSHDEELLDATFAADAQSSGITYGPSPSSGVSTVQPQCAVAVSGVATSSIVAFTWSESSGGAQTRISSAWYYVARPLAGGVPDLTKLASLHRATCSALLATPTTALPGTARDITVSRAVGPTNPAVTCDGLTPSTTCPVGTRIVALRLGVGLSSSTVFGVQGQRRLVS